MSSEAQTVQSCPVGTKCPLQDSITLDDRGLVGLDPQMKLQMKRETLIKLDRYANGQNLDQSFELDISYGHSEGELVGFDAVLTALHNKGGTSSSPIGGSIRRSNLESVKLLKSGRSAAW